MQAAGGRTSPVGTATIGCAGFCLAGLQTVRQFPSFRASDRIICIHHVPAGMFAPKCVFQHHGHQERSQCRSHAVCSDLVCPSNIMPELELHVVL